jgi:alkylation response protein AidB-like acyl-CoA dehydrogenase
VDLMPTAEQDEIAATVRAFLADRMPVAGLGRQPMTTEIDPGVWRECADLGWVGLGINEASGGVGYGLVEEMLLFRELGRGVAGGPFLPGVLAAHVAAGAGATDLARSIVAGDVRVALGTPIGPPLIGSTVTAEVSVAHLDGAELLVVCDGGAAAVVPLDACDVAPIDAVEGTVPTGRGAVRGVPAVAWVDAATSPVLDRALVLGAAMATGLAAAVLAVTVTHAGNRVQFGKPIGVNQAIKHWCADMAVHAEGAFAQVCYAAVAVRDALPGAGLEAAIAKYFADEAARLNSEGAVQIHGALGYTSEAVPYRYVHRAHLLARCVASRASLLDLVVPR